LSTASKQYFYLLSAIRGVAAILVVMRHTKPIFAPINFPMSFMAVDIFFILSGVVIDASYQKKLRAGLTPLQFTWLRVIRIYPLYILGCGLTVLTIFLMPGHHIWNGTDIYPIRHLALSWLFTLFLLPTPIPHTPEFPFDHPAWSLFFELAINIFYALIVTRLSTRRLIGLIAICGLGLLACLAFYHQSQTIDLGWKESTFIGGFFRTGVSFFLGVLIYRIYLTRPLPFITRHSGITSIAIVLAVIGALVMPISGGTSGGIYYVLCVFILFPAIIYAALAVQPGKRSLPFWAFLGDVSYPVYTFHVPIYFVLCSVLFGIFGLPITAHAPWAGISFLTVVVIAAAILDKTYDRPLQKRLRMLSGQKPVPADLQPEFHTP